VLRPDVSLSASGQRWFADEPAYALHTRGVRTTLTHQLTQPNVVTGRGAVSSLSASWIYEQEEFSITTEALADLSFRNQLIASGLDPRTGEGAGLLSALSLDYRRSTAADVLNSTRGYVMEAHVERGGGWLPGNYHYFEASLEGRHYQTLGRLGVLANRARLATIDGRGSEDLSVPFFKRYFLGGATNLRGWGRFEVAPLSGAGLPIGGTTFMFASVELRAPLWNRLGAVLFLDAGNVWTDPWSVDLEDVRFDVGPGLRYRTPIGPIRVDLGYQLNPIPGLLVNGEEQARRFRLHFSIGQAF
jgi:outer membrane protein insertion porin family/translocation and assembly module TamA